MSMQHVQGDPVAVRANGNLTAALWERAATHDPNDAFRHWRDGAWRGMTWAEAAERVRDIAGGLVALGVGEGDAVALKSATRMEWTLTDLAVLSAGAVTVPIDPEAPAGQGARILRDCGARLVVTATPEQATALVAGSQGRATFALDAGGLDTIAAHADGAARAEVDRRIARTGGGDVATIVDQRALTHDDVLAQARQSALRLRAMLRRSDTTLLCTPLCDGFARRLQFVCLEANVTLAFARSPDTVIADLLSFGPTVLPATAEVFEQLFAMTGSPTDGPRAKSFDFAVASAMRWAGRAHPSTLDNVRRTIADKLVYRDLRDAMGGQVRYGLCIGGPLAPEVVAVFAAAGITVLDGSDLADLGAPAPALGAGACPR